MYGEMKNNKKLREIYEKSLRVRSAIPHPRIQGVIRECGGKMYMSESASSLPLLVLLLLGIVVVAVDPTDPPPRPLSLALSLPLAEDWGKAQIDFFEAFKAYDEAGSPQRIQVLKYLVLAHMLTESDIDPFDSQETKPCVGSPALSCACTAALGVGAGLAKLEDLTRSPSSAGTRTTARSRP